MLGKILVGRFEDLGRSTQNSYLVSARELPWATPIFRLLDGNITRVTLSTSAVLTIGTMRIGDVFRAVLPDEGDTVGVAKGVFESRSRGRFPGLCT